MTSADKHRVHRLIYEKGLFREWVSECVSRGIFDGDMPAAFTLTDEQDKRSLSVAEEMLGMSDL